MKALLLFQVFLRRRTRENASLTVPYYNSALHFIMKYHAKCHMGILPGLYRTNQNEKSKTKHAETRTKKTTRKSLLCKYISPTGSSSGSNVQMGLRKHAGHDIPVPPKNSCEFRAPLGPPRPHATAPSPTHTAALATPGEITGVAAKLGERRFFKVALPETARHRDVCFSRRALDSGQAELRFKSPLVFFCFFFIPCCT